MEVPWGRKGIVSMHLQEKRAASPPRGGEGGKVRTKEEGGRAAQARPCPNGEEGTLGIKRVKLGERGK